MTTDDRGRARQRRKADFRFDDARLCFSLAGTLANRGTSRPIERLGSPADFARWCQESGCVAEPPTCDVDDLKRVRELRESIQHFGEALAAREPADDADIETINRAASHESTAPQLDAVGERVSWRASAASAVLSAVARDLILLIGSPLRDRVRLCGNQDCGVPFVDTSHAGTRRWCSMRTCGALEKKRAYRKRKRFKSVRDPSGRITLS